MLPKDNALEKEKIEIDQLVKYFFGIFNNKNGSSTNWNLIFEICIPESIIIKKDLIGHHIYNLQQFIEPRKLILRDGTLTQFDEFEVEEHTVISNQMAQRISKYRKNGLLNGVPFAGRGTKLFQFVKTDFGWKICSVVWQDDAI